MGTPNPIKPFASIVILLKEHKPISLSRLQQAVADAFRDPPEPPKVIALPDGVSFGVTLGPVRLGVMSRPSPYFKDTAKVADSISNFAAKKAVQDHQAWISVDVVGNPPVEPEQLYNVVGCLIAEFLGDDVLGLIRLPNGPVIGYDFSLIPLLRNRRVNEAFKRQQPDRVVKLPGNDKALAAATAEAQTRLPEFVNAFARGYKGQGFAVKKRFEVDGKIEHMWVVVTKLDGMTFHGWLSNDPQVIKSMKLRDPVQLLTDEIEDWIYSNGKENVGGFQAKAMGR